MKNKVKVVSRVVILVATVWGTSIAAAAPAIDWSDCQDELEQMQSEASDASEAAEDANSKLEDFENCRRDPDTFDLMQDGCKSVRSDYESAVEDFESKMEDVDVRIRSVQSSCGPR